MVSTPSKSRVAYSILNYVFCWVMALICLLPIWYMMCLSFSNKDAIVSGLVTVWPVNFTLDNYRYVTKDTQFYRSFFVSVERLLLGVSVQSFLTVLAAYPLAQSRHKFAARQFYVWYFMGAILFSGGMIPLYLVVSKLGLLNSIWSLILPLATPVFNVILLQNYIKGLPDALIECASLDGANHFTIMWRIILPLCLPCLATITLFLAVSHWNMWFDGMLYINDLDKIPLQTYLRSLVVTIDMNQITDIDTLSKQVASAGADSAKVFIAMVPILCVYPFLQKHFAKGIVMGSVKE